MPHRSLSSLIIAAALGLAVLPVPARAQTAGAPPETPATVTASGTFVLEVSLTVSPKIPNGTAVSLGARLEVLDSKGANTSTLSALVSPNPTVRQGKVAATIKLPYKWQLPAGTDQVTIDLDASAGTPYQQSPQYSDFFAWDELTTVPKTNGGQTVIKIAGTL